MILEETEVANFELLVWLVLGWGKPLGEGLGDSREEGNVEEGSGSVSGQGRTF